MPEVIMMDDSTIIRLAHQAAHDELSIAVFTVNELHRFAELVIEEHCKAPQQPRGVMVMPMSFEGDINLICHLDYDPAFTGSRDEPGCPESITLDSAYHYGRDIAHLLSEDIVEEIEQAALKQIEEDQNDF
jgi:hypothetical protein